MIVSTLLSVPFGVRLKSHCILERSHCDLQGRGKIDPAYLVKVFLTIISRLVSETDYDPNLPRQLYRDVRLTL